ncbi:N-formylglutamate amidohydrolase [Jannaschia sp. Os4]|uniref:N-formylglutamate amidohydrolase n=1 Tax=Jannaschia sp. Os4 TaxID=2807617 RepID=UPI00193951DD|nr:N-formylglutamate amidohydrolase [Jannaschia sp. Os4]MBM2574924.1 N-formylglutamate amidohydrolase [Jannaschia sp. Os4]
MTRRPFTLTRPAVPDTAVVVASPHSGRAYDWHLRRDSVLDDVALRSSEDAFVDLLLQDVPSHGAPLLAAEVPRAFVDLNRAPEELDPALVRDVPKGGTNPRVSSGLGVIPRVVAQGRAIYSGKISREEARARIEQVWQPYHDALHRLMDEAYAREGQAILIDVHSMPHEAIAHVAGPGGQPPEIVLGDRFGASAAGEVVDAAEAVFRDLGFRVARNAPFAGAYVVQAYGDPARGRHALQVEIDRALYMDEAKVRRGAAFDGMRQRIGEAMARICEIGRAHRGRVAAE